MVLVRDQPREVVDGAFGAFERAYTKQPVTGPKARALVLVALLWASRHPSPQKKGCLGFAPRLHGNNAHNEKYLLSRLHTAPRMMNKAFTTLARAVQPDRNCDSCPCPQG